MRTRNFMQVSWHARFLKAAVAYNLVVFIVFLAAYIAMDFSEHFESREPVTLRGKVYYAIMAHTAVGSNDITPKTDVARTVTAAHVSLAWMQLLLVFFN